MTQLTIVKWRFRSILFYQKSHKPDKFDCPNRFMKIRSTLQILCFESPLQGRTAIYFHELQYVIVPSIVF
jgi:hypothetical protein